MLVGPKKLLRCAAVLCILKWWNKSQFKCFFAVSECAFWTKILAQTQGQEFVIRMADICRISAEIRTQTNWYRVILMLDPLIRRINTIRITNSQIREPECGYLSDIYLDRVLNLVMLSALFCINCLKCNLPMTSDIRHSACWFVDWLIYHNFP